MGQKLYADNYPLVVRASTTTLTLASTNAGYATRITIGGQQYKASGTITLSTASTGFNGIDTGTFTAATIYNIFAVQSSGVLGMVISASTSPTGFSSYKFLGKLIAATGATISHVMNVGERFVEYAYNTTTGDTDDTTGFGYGIDGGLFPQSSISTDNGRSKRIRFLVAMVSTDVIEFQVDSNSESQWATLVYNRDLADDQIRPYDRQTSIYYGAGGLTPVSASTTDLDVRFGRYCQTNATYGGVGINWSSAINSNYRVTKYSKIVTGP